MKRLLGKLTKKRMKIGVVLLSVIAVLLISIASLNNNTEIKSIQSLAKAVIIKAHLEIVPEGYTEIRTPEQLEAINDNLSGNYILMQDIDMTSITHEVIGKTSSTAFTGIFDGNGYTISNINIESNNQYIGMFGYVNRGTVKDLVIENIKVISTSQVTTLYMGGIVGYNSEGTVQNITANNIVIEGNANYLNKLNELNIGGVLGYSYKGKINNITVSGNIKNVNNVNTLNMGGILGKDYQYSTSTIEVATNQVKMTTSENAQVTTINIGGISGYGGTINDATNEVNIEVSNIDNIIAGGILGYGGTATNSINKGKMVLTGKKINVGGISGNYGTTLTNVTNEGEIKVTGETIEIGGIASNKAIITDATNKGKIIVEGKNVNVGGIVGNINNNGATISKLINEGEIVATSTGTTNIGGIVGYLQSITLQQSYSTGKMTINSTSTSNNVGGIVGYQYAGKVKNTFSTAEIGGNIETGAVGGIVGYLYGYSYNISGNTTYVYAEVSYSYAIGLISIEGTNARQGGLIGQTSAKYYTILNSYWSPETTRLTTSATTIEQPKTIQLMLNKDTYKNWNFNTIWDIKENKGSLPYLRDLSISENILEENLNYTKYEGAGTEENPFLIDTVEKLQNIKLGLDKSYKIIKDLDMTGIMYDIIGKTTSDKFTGMLDGNGHKISNLNIESNNSYVGLFGYAENATIKNLTLENVKLKGTSQGNINIGGIVGELQNGNIENVHIIGDSIIEDTENAKQAYIGLLIGYLNSSNSSNNSANGKIITKSSNNKMIGGLIGNSSIGNIQNSNANLILKNYGAGGIYGGLIGEARATNISKCYTNNIIDAKSSGVTIGGLVGYIHNSYDKDSSVDKSYSIGKIDILEGTAGGLIGKINNWADSGSGTITNRVKISNVYSTVDVNISSGIAGGLIGNYHSAATLNNAYSIGEIKAGTGETGGLIGKMGTAYISNPVSAYWAIETSDQLSSSGGTGKAFEEMLRRDIYQNWDFDATWSILENKSLPYLSELPIPKEICHNVNLEGKGTKEEPYIIKTLDELKNIHVWPAYFELGNDLDADGIEDFNPKKFIGILDGKNHSINNLTIKSDDKYAGVFRENTGTIKNIKLNNLNIESSCSDDTSYIGGIVGYNRGTLKNIEITGTIKNIGTVTNLHMGQISGYNESLIEKTHSNGKLANEGLTTNGYIGGIAGYNDGNIRISYNTGNITINNVENLKVGGITGKSDRTITDSYSNGNTNIIATNASIGGIVGESSGRIKNTYSIDKIEKIVEKGNIGGIAGEQNAFVISSYWNIDNITQQAENGKLKTLEELKQEFTYENWDFENIWNIQENVNTPVFKGIFNNDENYYEEEEFGDDFWEWHTRTTTDDKAYNGTHIVINKGQSIDFYGYGVTSYKDYLYKYYDGAGEKIFMFKIDETKASYHTLDGAGFIFNASKKDNKLSGYILLITENDINIYRIDDVDTTEFETTASRTVQSYAGVPIASVPKNSSTIHNLMVKASPTNVTVIDNNKEMLNVALDYSKHSGEDFGLISSYTQHDCSILTKIQFLGFVMEVRDYTVPVLKIDSQGNRLEGAKFQVKNEEGEIVREGITNTKGIFNIKGLQEGIYTLEEIEAPAKYAFKNNTITFKVTNDGKVLDVNTEEEIEIKIINEALKFVVKVEDVKGNPISGSKVSLYDAEGNAVIGSNGQPIVVTTGADGAATITDIEAGAYTFKQTEVSDDYILNDTIYTVTIEKDGTVTFKEDLNGVIVNKKYGHVLLTKYKTGTTIPLKDAVIEIKDVKGNSVRLTTNTAGTITFKAPPGTYTYKEVTAPTGYILNDAEHTFIVADDGTVTYDNTNGIIYNDRVIMTEGLTITKYKTNTTIGLAGATIAIFDADGNKVAEKVTGENGQVTFTGLEVGSYYYKEISAPAGYVLNDTEYHFTVNNDGTVTFAQNANRIIYNDREIVYGDVTITKYKTGTQTPLAGAVIGIYKADGTPMLDKSGNPVQITTSSQGTITFKIAPGTYQYREIAAPVGYVLNNTTYTFTVSEEGVVTFDSANGIIYNARVTMTEGLTITKYKTNTTIPIAGATIAVFDVDGHKIKEAITGENGQVTFTGLEVGSYYYKEIKAPEGYILNNTEYHFTVNNEGTVTAEEGTNYIIYNDRVTTQHVIITKYITGTTIPVPGAVIGLFDVNGNEIIKDGQQIKLTTDNNGQIDFTNLEVGTYKYKEIEAPEGYILNETMYTFTVENDGTVKFETARGIIYNDRVIMKDDLVITKKKTQTDILIPGAVIGIFNENGEEIQRKTTNEVGTVTFIGLEVGSYYYKEIKAPEGYILNNTEYHFTVENDGSITLTQGVNKTIYNDAITKDHIIITKYVTNTVTPVPGAIIGLFDADGNKIKEETTNENGQVDFAGLEPGRYTYKELVAPEGYILNETTYTFEIAKDGRVTFDSANAIIYNDKEIIYTDVTLIKYEEETQTPVAGAIIGIYDTKGNILTDVDGNEMKFTTNEAGIITVKLTPGTYQYKEIKAPEGYILNETTYTFTVLEDGTITFRENTNGIIYNKKKEDEPIKPEPIYGDVTLIKYEEETRTPVAGAVIGIYDINGNAIKNSEGKAIQFITNEKGEIKFKARPGTYQYKEIKAPDGYILNETMYTFTVSEDGIVTFKDNTQGIIYNKKKEDKPEKPEIIYGNVTLIKYEEGTTIGLKGAIIGIYDANKNETKITTTENGTISFKAKPGVYQYQELVAPDGYELNNTIYTFTVAKDGTVTFDSANGIIYNKKKEEKPDVPDVPDNPDIPDKPDVPNKPDTPENPKGNVIIPGENTIVKEPEENIANGKLPQTGQTEEIIAITLVLVIAGIYFGIKIKDKQ